MQSLKRKLRKRYFAAWGNAPDIVVRLLKTKCHDPVVLILGYMCTRTGTSKDAVLSEIVETQNRRNHVSTLEYTAL